MNVKKISYSSSANLGPGYDILSISHGAFYDEVSVENSDDKKIKIISDKTPENPDKNTAGLSLMKIMEDKDIHEGIKVSIKKNVPIGLGLGSSGASSSAAVKAFNELFNLNMTKDEMVYYSMYGEIAACGAAHPDNVSSGIYGGLTLISSKNPIRVKKIKINYNFNLMLLIPEININEKTKLARSMVPDEVKIDDLVEQTSHLSSMLYGFFYGDRDEIRYGMDDRIVEISRQSLFPFYKNVREKALGNNAVSVCISGAGPTILIFTDDKTNKKQIKMDINNIMGSFKLKYDIIETNIMEGYDE